MRRDTRTRAMRRLMHRVSHSLMAAAFAGMGQPSAATLQIDLKVRHEVMQLPSMPLMDSCAQCPACQLAPAFESDTSGSGGHPEHGISAPWIRPQEESRKTWQSISDNAIRPTLSLRLFYCRWLN